MHFIVLPRLYAWARLDSLSFCLVCLLPWHSSLSAHNFQGAFSRATKLARPLAKVVIYCSVVFWKKRTEQKLPTFQNTKNKTTFRQQRLKLFLTKKTRFRVKRMCGYKVMTHFVNLGLIFVDRLCKNTTHQHVAANRHMLAFISE